MNTMSNFVIASVASLSAVTIIRNTANMNHDDRSSVAKIALSVAGITAALVQLRSRDTFEVRDEVAVLDT